MEVLLFAGILLVVLALLGFGGVIRALHRIAWILLLVALAMIVAALVL